MDVDFTYPAKRWLASKPFYYASFSGYKLYPSAYLQANDSFPSGRWLAVWDNITIKSPFAQMGPLNQLVHKTLANKRIIDFGDSFYSRFTFQIISYI